jgi:hypothetical protein
LNRLPIEKFSRLLAKAIFPAVFAKYPLASCFGMTIATLLTSSFASSFQKGGLQAVCNPPFLFTLPAVKLKCYSVLLICNFLWDNSNLHKPKITDFRRNQ